MSQEPFTTPASDSGSLGGSGIGSGPQEHGDSLKAGSVGLLGSMGIGVGSVAPTVSIALTLAALLAATGLASPIAVLIYTIPMLCLALAFRRLNEWRVSCGATYLWGGLAISPYFGFAVGWIILLTYTVGMVSDVLPVGPYAGSLVHAQNSRVFEALIAFGAVVLITLAAYVGIKATARVQWILLGVEYIGVTILAVYSLISVFTRAAGAVHFSWSWFGWHQMGGRTGLVSAALVAVFMISGWDTTILINEETGNARKTPGTSVVATVAVVGVLFAILTFAFEGAVSSNGIATHSDALAYIGQVRAGSWLSKWIVLAVALSALGSALAGIVSGVRVTFAMAFDQVLPRFLARTHPRYKVPHIATILFGLVASVGVLLYTLGSSSVEASFVTIVSVSGLLYILFYSATGLTSAVYFRRVARSGWLDLLQLVVLPLASAAFLLYVAWKAVPGLGGWGGGTMISLYVMFAIGAGIMFDARFRTRANYFAMARQVYDPQAEARSKKPSDATIPR
jgi:amino acid transporter